MDGRGCTFHLLQAGTMIQAGTLQGIMTELAVGVCMMTQPRPHHALPLVGILIVKPRGCTDRQTLWVY